MEEQISSTLMFCDTAKEVWTQAQELFSGVNNLHRIYDLHQSFFSVSQDDLSLKAYYAKFSCICNELDVCEPLSTDIHIIRRQLQRMRVTRFLSGASSLYGPVSKQILGSPDLPSLGEVFNRLRQSTASTPIPPTAPSSDRSALASSCSEGSGFSVSSGHGRSRASGFRGRGRDSGFSGRGDFGGRFTNSGGRMFGRGRST